MTVNTFIPIKTVSRMIDFTPIGREKVIERLTEENKKGVNGSFSSCFFLLLLPNILDDNG